MKKLLVCLLMIGTIAYLTASRPANVVASHPAGVPTQADQLIRFHVVANSDTSADQALKRRVRDVIVEYMAPRFREANSLEEAREIAGDNLAAMEKLAAIELKQAGVDYGVEGRLGKFMFPTKTYGKFSLPAGEYEAVRIVLGKGEGANWWCVLFPPLCFVDLTNGLAANPALLMQNGLQNKPEQNRQVNQPTNRQGMATGVAANPTDPEKGQIEVRFLLGELFDKLIK